MPYIDLDTNSTDCSFPYCQSSLYDIHYLHFSSSHIVNMYYLTQVFFYPIFVITEIADLIVYQYFANNKERKACLEHKTNVIQCDSVECLENIFNKEGLKLIQIFFFTIIIYSTLLCHEKKNHRIFRGVSRNTCLQ